jgi:ElaA protein
LVHQQAFLLLSEIPLAMVHFSCLPFDALSPHTLYEILALRQEVFVVEQNCPYQDCDGNDQASYHLMGRNEQGKLICYTRLIPKGISYPDYVSIGRVVSSPSARGTGAGIILMEESIRKCRELFGHEPIKIGAQSYLLKFYERFGFRSTGEEYLEDGIPHTKMILEGTKHKH